MKFEAFRCVGLFGLAATAAIVTAGCEHSAASPGQATTSAPLLQLPETKVESAAPAATTVAAGPATATANGTEGSEPSVANVAIANESAPSEATPATPPAGQRPPADRGPARPGEAEKISFDDLNLGMREDMVYRPFLLTDRVKELDGKRLSIIGYMHGGVESTKNVKEFVLLKNTECKFGPGGQADHLAQVYLAEGATTALTSKPIKVEATLKVQPFEGIDGNTWYIYRLEGAKVVR